MWATGWQVGFLSQGYPNHPCIPQTPMGKSSPYSLGTGTTSSSLPHRPGGTRRDRAGDSGTGPTWKVLDATGTTGDSVVMGEQRAQVRQGLGALPDGERGKSLPLCPMRQLWLKPNSVTLITIHHLLHWGLELPGFENWRCQEGSGTSLCNWRVMCLLPPSDKLKSDSCLE